METKKLYPFRFSPESVEKDWGEERLLLCDLGQADSTLAEGWLAGNTLSELMQTYLERVVGETSFEYYGTQFPIAVREFTLEKGRRSSLHVNPDDETAEQRYDSFGRPALWYVVEAGEGARVWMGFKEDISAEDFYRRCLDGTLEEVLHGETPKAGDAFMIEPGTVHGAKGPLKIIEVSEASDLFFRIHGWDSNKELHLEEAFDLVDFRKWDRKAGLRHLAGGKEITEPVAQCPQFAVTLFRVKDPLRVSREETDGFLIYTCVRGSVLLKVEDGDSYPLKAGETLLVPDEVGDFYLIPEETGTELLETLLPERKAEEPQPEAEE